MRKNTKSDSTKEIIKNFFLLDDLNFPLYLIKAEYNALIDSAVLANAKKIETQIKKQIADEKLSYIFLTHSHYDHTGAISELQKSFDFTIISSSRTKEILENEDAIKFIDDLNQKYCIMVNSDIKGHFEKPKKLISLKEGNEIFLGKKRLIRVYETPGHTRCSLSFLLIPDNVLFCGDAAGILEKNRQIKPLFLSSYIQYMQSIKKLISLNAKILALSHNLYIEGEKKIRDFLIESVAESEKTKSIMIDYLKRGFNLEKCAKEILTEHFPSSTLLGPKEALIINITAMLKALKKENFC